MLAGFVGCGRCCGVDCDGGSCLFFIANNGDEIKKMVKWAKVDLCGYLKLKPKEFSPLSSGSLSLSLSLMQSQITKIPPS